MLHFITGIGGGGAENFLRGLATTMDGSRWQTVIVVVRVHPHEDFVEELRARGCTVHDLNANALLNLGVWTATRRLIQQERPDIVQTWMHHADFIGGIAAWSAGYRNVVWGVRAMEMHRNPGDSRLKIGLFQRALGFCSKWMPRKIITNSTGAIGVHAAMGYPRDKFVWVPNGVNAGRFSPRPEMGSETRKALNIPPEVPVVGFIGRFHPVKDLALFFDAAALVQARQPEVHLVLMGGTVDELYPAAREAFEKLPRREQVRFVPFGACTDRYYPAFSLFSLCSESEAFPNVVLEAMACGVPCATTNAGDCAIMLENLGEVVPVRDRQAMAEAWRRMLGLSAAERAALEVKSHTRAAQEYSLERAARRFEDVYDS
ncbi:MAG: hypothetical protein JWO94_1360, partial [Verrucomicrobiaceae bacterium]|nr:hypothetical protein [Verrucomicrobiaceae bacterium]